MSFDSFDFGGLSDLSLSDISFDAINVDSFTDLIGIESLSNIGSFPSFDVQSLTTFAQDSWTKVTDFAGNPEWFNATSPGSILGSASPIGSALASGYNTISRSASSLVTSTINQVSDPAFQRSLATNVVNQVSPGLVSQIAGIGTVGQLVNRSLNTNISDAIAIGSGTPAFPAVTGQVTATSAISNTDAFGLNILSDAETNALIRNNINPAFINGLQPVALTDTEIVLAEAGVNVTAPGAVIEDPFGESRLAAEAALNAAGPTEQDVLDGIQRSNAAATAALTKQAQEQQTIRAQRQTKAQASDWRVRLRLAPRSNYLYNAPNPGPLLQPLRVTDGVIFPYTPQIDTAYKANYSTYDLTHSNYRGYFYQNSYVDAINIRAQFTAQDTFEANYLLAVIHFFRSATKMFYGQDDAAKRGSPPPMVYLSGLGDFQFNEHPCLIQQFNYTLPSDVDYIRAQSTLIDGQNLITKRDRQNIPTNPLSYALQRLATSGLTKGGMDIRPIGVNPTGTGNPTYVPTKMEIAITLLPTQSRSQVSDQFSVENFANGNLLKGGFW